MTQFSEARQAAMTERTVLTDGLPSFHVVAWEPEGDANFWRRDNGKAGYAEFAVWEVLGVEQNGALVFRHRAQGRTTTTRLDAVRTARGTVKWDGCVNFQVGESEDVGYDLLLHACDAADLRSLFDAVLAGYEMASVLVGADQDP